MCAWIALPLCCLICFVWLWWPIPCTCQFKWCGEVKGSHDSPLMVLDISSEGKGSELQCGKREGREQRITSERGIKGGKATRLEAWRLLWWGESLLNEFWKVFLHNIIYFERISPPSHKVVRLVKHCLPNKKVLCGLIGITVQLTSWKPLPKPKFGRARFPPPKHSSRVLLVNKN